MKASSISRVALTGLLTITLANPLAPRSAVCGTIFGSVAKCCSIDAVKITDVDCIDRMFRSSPYSFPGSGLTMFPNQRALLQRTKMTSWTFALRERAQSAVPFQSYVPVLMTFFEQRVDCFLSLVSQDFFVMTLIDSSSSARTDRSTVTFW
jgi:hypothetical protein